MTNEERKARVVQLLEAAAAAHHEYEVQELDGMRDEGWPHWYAAYLLENGLSEMLSPALNQGALAEFLADSHEQFDAEKQEENWQTYTAGKMLSHFS
jgi:hypothetical protein